MYKGIIFDLDGTLLDTITDITDSINYALSISNLQTYKVNDVKYFVGSGVDILVERATRITNRDDEVFIKVKNDYNSKYAELQKNKTAPYDGIIETIKKIKKLGVKVGVVSNKPQADVERVIAYYFGNDLFSLTFGQRPGFLPKPDPTTVNEMVDLFELDRKDILYVGDSDVDMKTSINASLDAVAVLWGFRTKMELTKYNPRFVIDKPSQLIDIVCGKSEC